MTSGELYEDRARAQSFGAVAQAYDRYRPAHPAALIDDLLAPRPSKVLDAACGTGRVATELVARGVDVLGVELDPRMADVARGHGVTVEVGSFEEWDDRGRRFDLITCGAAWHWIDPVRGVEKAAELLRPGGVMARFWTYYVLDEPVVSALDAVYRELAPDAHAHGRPGAHVDAVDAFDSSESFTAVDRRTYRSAGELGPDEWVALVATFSDHQRLGPQRLGELQARLRATIAGLGDAIHTHVETYALFSSRI